MGINQRSSFLSHKCKFKINSHINLFSVDISCLVVPSISEKLPLVSIDHSQWKLPQNLKLADPCFNRSAPIDLLIGIQLFWKLLSIGHIALGKGLPIAQKTQLGLVISGTMSSVCNGNVTRCNFFKFWEIKNYLPQRKPCAKSTLDLHIRELLKEGL